MPVPIETVETLLHASFPDSVIDVEDQKGNGDYYSIYIKSDSFAGKSRVQRHKMVHVALNEVISDIHAITLKLNTKDD